MRLSHIIRRLLPISLYLLQVGLREWSLVRIGGSVKMFCCEHELWMASTAILMWTVKATCMLSHYGWQSTEGWGVPEWPWNVHKACCNRLSHICWVNRAQLPGKVSCCTTCTIEVIICEDSLQWWWEFDFVKKSIIKTTRSALERHFGAGFWVLTCFGS